MTPITKNEMKEWVFLVCKFCRAQTGNKFLDDEKCSMRCIRIRRAIEKLIEKQGGKKAWSLSNYMRGPR